MRKKIKRFIVMLCVASSLTSMTAMPAMAKTSKKTIVISKKGKGKGAYVGHHGIPRSNKNDCQPSVEYVPPKNTMRGKGSKR